MHRVLWMFYIFATFVRAVRRALRAQSANAHRVPEMSCG
jgi:hypothetical protein